MAERKIIDKTGSAAKSEKKLDLGKLNIDFDEIKKLIPSIVSALMTDSKLLKNLKKKPVETMKKIVKKEDLSDNTKNAIKSILKDNKDSDLPTILDKIGDATDGDTSNVFDSLKDLVAGDDDLDIGDVIKGVSILKGSKSKSKTKSESKSSGLMNMIGKFFK